jgi:demethylmenaquinone methyltransferase/2-methoxy-6-polyprenyl-1,4-benzoquinol methylase
VLSTSPIAYPKRKDPMSRYTHSASWYDTVSAEPIYRVGRERAIPALHLQEGSRVLDIGCGTGLNFPLLLAAVGRSGQVVGVDRSREMLEVARRKMIHLPPGNVALVKADAEQLDHVAVGLDARDSPFDAVLFTYSLSLMSNWERAWLRATSLVRPGGRAGIVDMDSPHGWARLLDPAARLACWLGGADINARPWTLLERAAADVQSWSFRGGHVQVRVGTL